jgi:hypothetical protein
MRMIKNLVAVLGGTVIAVAALSAGATQGGPTINHNQQHSSTASTGRTCPRGETLRQGRCEGPNGCPAGETKTNGMCACPAGKVMLHDRCVSPNACPPPGQFTNGRCVATPTCPSAYHLDNGQCVARAR